MIPFLIYFNFIHFVAIPFSICCDSLIIMLLFPFYHVLISGFFFLQICFMCFFSALRYFYISTHRFEMYFYSCIWCYICFVYSWKDIYLVFCIIFRICFCIWYIFFSILFHIMFLILSVWYVTQILQSSWEPFPDHTASHPGKSLCSRSLKSWDKNTNMCDIFLIHVLDLLMSFNFLSSFLIPIHFDNVCDVYFIPSVSNVVVVVVVVVVNLG